MLEYTEVKISFKGGRRKESVLHTINYLMGIKIDVYFCVEIPVSRTHKFQKSFFFSDVNSRTEEPILIQFDLWAYFDENLGISICLFFSIFLIFFVTLKFGCS